MKKILMVLLLLLPSTVFALNDTASSSIVMDTKSGRILYEKAADNSHLIASTTKIMTAVIAIENGDLNKTLTAHNEILKMYGTSIYLELNERLTLKDLLYGLLLRSGNDAAVVIANNICNNEDNFVKLMNNKALELGMNNTHFENVHGLDEVNENVSTAKDMAILSSYAINLPEYKKISATKKYITKSNTKSYIWYNRNKFLKSYKYATGGKNGYTPKAGKTLVTTAHKNNLSITTVTLKDKDPFTNHKLLDNYIFKKYKNELIIDKNNFTIPHVTEDVYIKHSFSYPLTTKEQSHLKILININTTKNYVNNQSIGEVSVYLYQNKIYTEDVYVKIKNSNPFYKLLDYIKNVFR